MTVPRKHKLVLGLYPNSRGFAYGLFEGPFAPVDWGVVEIRGVECNKRCLGRIAVLLNRHEPDILVLQDSSHTGTRRARRIRDLNEAIAVLAETQGIATTVYSREQVRRCFGSGLVTKQAIAEAIAKRIPMFERFVPPPRKLWTSEHPRMGLFDAASLVLTFYFQ